MDLLVAFCHLGHPKNWLIDWLSPGNILPPVWTILNTVDHTEYLIFGDVEPGYAERWVFVILIAVNDHLPVVDAPREPHVTDHHSVVEARCRHRTIVVSEQHVARRRRRVEPEPRHYRQHRRHRKVKKRPVKADIALHGNPISELRDVTCHMGSHSVTCHPTQVNAPRLTPAMQAGTRFTYPGGMEGWVDL